MGRSIDAVRDLEEPEFSARDRNTQVFFKIIIDTTNKGQGEYISHPTVYS